MFTKTLCAGLVAITANMASADPWNGAYVGGYLGSFEGDQLVGIAAGYNMTVVPSVVLGAELESFQFTSGPGGDETWLNLRAGYLVSPNFLFYGSYGLGGFTDSLDFGTIDKVAVGGEYAVSGSITIRAEIAKQNTGPVMDGPTVSRLGAFWHF